MGKDRDPMDELTWFHVSYGVSHSITYEFSPMIYDYPYELNALL